MDQHPWRLGPRGRRWLDGLLVLGILVLGGVGHVAAGQPVAALFSVRDDQEVTVTVTGRERSLQVVVSDGWGRAGLVSQATLAALDPAPQPVALWARASEGADARTSAATSPRWPARPGRAWTAATPNGRGSTSRSTS